MSENLRVLVVGMGLIGRRRAQGVRQLEGVLPVRLAGTVDPDAAALAHMTDAHHASLGAVDPSSYDAAIVAVPHDVAGEIAGSILELGKPILLEKPLAVSAGPARELVALAGEVHAPSFVGYNYRFLAPVFTLFEQLRGGELGVLRNVDLLIGHGGHPRSAEGWKLRPERAGGGVLLDPGVHLLDLLLRIEPSLACSHVEVTKGFWGTGIEEDLVAVFAHQQLIATVRVSHVRWINTFRIEIGGEDGYGIVEGRGGNYGPQTLRLGRRWAWHDSAGLTQRQTERELDFGLEDRSLEAELEAVIGHWTGVTTSDGPQPATMDEALAVTELCDSIYAKAG